MPVEYKIIGWQEKENETAIFLTPWSLVHFLGGMAAKQTQLFSPFWWFMTHGAYEAKDQVARDKGIMYNSFLNSVGDQTVAMVGFYVAPSSPDMSLLWVWAGSLVFASIMEDTSAGDWIG